MFDMYTNPFSDIKKDDVSLAGGKGASLGEMTQAGIPVPPGFVVVASAFDHFLKEADLQAEIQTALGGAKTEATHTLEEASQIIRSLILAAEIPGEIAREIQTAFQALNTPCVAVRSSATVEDGASAAWAGQLDTFLNTTASDLLQNVRQCWASLFTPRAMFYRAEQGLTAKHVSVAVVVQKMIQSEVSGVAFSVHPVTEDPNQIIIEAVWGLGEALVSGELTPDGYVVHKDGWEISDYSVSEQTWELVQGPDGVTQKVAVPEERQSQQKLSDLQIVELARLVKTIEEHYGFPVDVEWAYARGVFFILQSRPITTLR